MTLLAVIVVLVATAASAGAQGLKAMWGPSVEGGVSQFPVYHDLGVQLLETRIDWATTAERRPAHPRDPSDPAYSWPADVSSDIASSGRYGIKVAVELIATPRWANGGRSTAWAPTKPSDFADFATAAARRFPGVHLWMIWGEPSRANNFLPLTPAKPYAKLNAKQAGAPHRYARMLDAAYSALKHVSSKNLVIGGMTYTTGDISTQQWIENMRLPNGKAPRLDLYGHNPFSFRDPNLANPPGALQSVDFSDLGRLAKLVDKNLGRPTNPHPRLFLSEWTIPTFIDDEFNFFTTPAVQAKWITDGLTIARRWSRIYAVGWIHLYDDPPVTGGGLLMADGTKKPGYYAWKSG